MLYGIPPRFYLTDMKPLLLLLLLLSACRNPATENSIVLPEIKSGNDAAVKQTVFTTPPFKYDYEAIKKRCQSLFEEHKKKNLPATKQKLISYLVDSLIPCWYGTPWDYNGTTEVPGEGKIACGYFVTTTLRDAGMKINRVKMAQCVSQNLLYDLCGDFKKFSDKPLDYFVKEVARMGYGLYIVGLDNHTGYIYHDGKDVWFIHSGVYSPRCALKELASGSITLNNSRYRVIGRIKL